MLMYCSSWKLNLMPTPVSIPAEEESVIKK